MPPHGNAMATPCKCIRLDNAMAVLGNVHGIAMAYYGINIELWKHHGPFRGNGMGQFDGNVMVFFVGCHEITSHGYAMDTHGTLNGITMKHRDTSCEPMKCHSYVKSIRWQRHALLCQLAAMPRRAMTAP